MELCLLCGGDQVLVYPPFLHSSMWNNNPETRQLSQTNHEHDNSDLSRIDIVNIVFLMIKQQILELNVEAFMYV